MKQIENRNATLKMKYPHSELLQNYIVGNIKFKPSRADVLSHSISIMIVSKLLAAVVSFPEQDEILGRATSTNQLISAQTMILKNSILN